MAAARKVSPPARTRPRPASVSRLASLPMVVVLPTPFTPTKSHTLGASAARARPRSPASRSFISAFSAPSSSSPSSMAPSSTWARKVVRRSSVVATPTSAVISASSSSSQVSASTFERDRSDAMNLDSWPLVRPSRSSSSGGAASCGLCGRGQRLVVGRTHAVRDRAPLFEPDDEGDRRQADGQHDDQDQDQDLHRGGGYPARQASPGSRRGSARPLDAEGSGRVRGRPGGSWPRRPERATGVVESSRSGGVVTPGRRVWR